MSNPFNTISAATAQAAPARPMTINQRTTLRAMMLEKAQLKGMDLQQADDILDTWLAELDFDKASFHITNTIAYLASAREFQKATAARQEAMVDRADAKRATQESVPAGRYAVPTEDGATNDLAFYKVDRPTEGKWAGYVFVKLLTGGEERRLSRAAQTAVLAKIARVGAEQAAATYGHQIGRCGICHTRLTNDESRARGIGPVCAAKMGW